MNSAVAACESSQITMCHYLFSLNFSLEKDKATQGTVGLSDGFSTSTDTHPQNSILASQSAH